MCSYVTVTQTKFNATIGNIINRNKYVPETVEWSFQKTSD